MNEISLHTVFQKKIILLQKIKKTVMADFPIEVISTITGLPLEELMKIIEDV